MTVPVDVYSSLCGPSHFNPRNYWVHPLGGRGATGCLTVPGDPSMQPVRAITTLGLRQPEREPIVRRAFGGGRPRQTRNHHTLTLAWKPWGPTYGYFGSPVAVGADRSCGVWMIRATVEKLVEMVHFEVRALLSWRGAGRRQLPRLSPGLVQPTVLVVASLRFAAIHRISLGGTFISSWIFVKT